MESNSASRIKRSSEFDELRLSGHRVSVCPEFFLSYKKVENNQLAFGITVSRKVGNAVIRNKLKRFCREILENSDLKLPHGYKINIIFRPQAAGFFQSLHFSDFADNFSKALSRLK